MAAALLPGRRAYTNGIFLTEFRRKRKSNGRAAEVGRERATRTRPRGLDYANAGTQPVRPAARGAASARLLESCSVRMPRFDLHSHSTPPTAC